MKFQAQMTVVGMKANKGAMDNGQTFDSTKVYVLTDMDQSKGQLGQATAEYNLGLSGEIEKYRHLAFPFLAQCDCEIVTNGKTQKTVITGLRPVDAKADQKAARVG